MNFGIGLTLRDGNREYFYEQLDKLFPGLKEKYIEIYGNAYEVTSPDSDRLMKIFYELCEENNIVYDEQELQRYMREYKNKQIGTQLSLFDM